MSERILHTAVRGGAALGLALLPVAVAETADAATTEQTSIETAELSHLAAADGTSPTSSLELNADQTIEDGDEPNNLGIALAIGGGALGTVIARRFALGVYRINRDRKARSADETYATQRQKADDTAAALMSETGFETRPNSLEAAHDMIAGIVAETVLLTKSGWTVGDLSEHNDVLAAEIETIAHDINAQHDLVDNVDMRPLLATLLERHSYIKGLAEKQAGLGEKHMLRQMVVKDTIMRMWEAKIIVDSMPYADSDLVKVATIPMQFENLLRQLQTIQLTSDAYSSIKSAAAVEAAEKAARSFESTLAQVEPLIFKITDEQLALAELNAKNTADLLRLEDAYAQLSEQVANWGDDVDAATKAKIVGFFGRISDLMTDASSEKPALGLLEKKLAQANDDSHALAFDAERQREQMVQNRQSLAKTHADLEHELQGLQAYVSEHSDDLSTITIPNPVDPLDLSGSKEIVEQRLVAYGKRLQTIRTTRRKAEQRHLAAQVERQLQAEKKRKRHEEEELRRQHIQVAAKIAGRLGLPKAPAEEPVQPAAESEDKP